MPARLMRLMNARSTTCVSSIKTLPLMPSLAFEVRESPDDSGLRIPRVGSCVICIRLLLMEHSAISSSDAITISTQCLPQFSRAWLPSFAPKNTFWPASPSAQSRYKPQAASVGLFLFFFGMKMLARRKRRIVRPQVVDGFTHPNNRNVASICQSRIVSGSPACSPSYKRRYLAHQSMTNCPCASSNRQPFATAFSSEALRIQRFVTVMHGSA